MRKVLQLLPELQGEEMIYVENIIQNMNDESAEHFAHVYRARRKDPQTTLILCIVSLFAIPGLQRIFVNQIGMAILYFFTANLCFIGGIIDLINYQKLTMEYNTKMIDEILPMTELRLKANE